jgi:hypothetical protein
MASARHIYLTKTGPYDGTYVPKHVVLDSNCISSKWCYIYRNVINTIFFPCSNLCSEATKNV